MDNKMQMLKSKGILKIKGDEIIIEVDSIETLWKIIDDVKYVITETDSRFIIDIDIDEKNVVPDEIKNIQLDCKDIHPLIYLIEQDVDLSRVVYIDEVIHKMFGLINIYDDKVEEFFNNSMSFYKRVFGVLKDRDYYLWRYNFSKTNSFQEVINNFKNQIKFIIFDTSDILDYGILDKILKDLSDIPGVEFRSGNGWIERGTCGGEKKFIESVLRIKGLVESLNINLDEIGINDVKNIISTNKELQFRIIGNGFWYNYKRRNITY